MKKLLFVCLVLVFVFPCVVKAFLLPTAKLTLKVIDEQGLPVKGADVTIAYEVPKAAGRGWGSDNVFQRGSTGENGLFSADGEGASTVGFSAEKAGYYTSDDSFHFKSKSLLNRWEPWNPTIEVVLKKKRNPVSMFSNNTDVIKSPIVNEPVGYDLEKGDWVTPYGKGTTSDFIFTLRTNYKSYSQYQVSLTLGFSNKDDGIQEYLSSDKDQSYFKWPFEAPIDGYKNNLSREKSDSPGNGMFKNTKENAKYIFRVRTKVDKTGKIISANYGKIPEEFGFDPTGNVRFSYYYNPDGTQNLEFDPEKNLFKWTREQRDHMVKNP